jgi:hypothetical protein
MQQAMFGMGGASPAAAAAAAPAPEAPSQPDWSTQLQHMRELGIIDEVYIEDKSCMSVCYLVYSTKYALMYLEYHSVCPLVEIGTTPPPPPQARVTLPGAGGGGAHLPAGEAVKLSTLPTLWYTPRLQNSRRAISS